MGQRWLRRGSSGEFRCTRFAAAIWNYCRMREHVAFAAASTAWAVLCPSPFGGGAFVSCVAALSPAELSYLTRVGPIIFNRGFKPWRSEDTGQTRVPKTPDTGPGRIGRRREGLSFFIRSTMPRGFTRSVSNSTASPLSWPSPRVPACSPFRQRAGVRTEDHPLYLREFEGTIPKASMAQGRHVMDQGSWKAESYTTPDLRRSPSFELDAAPYGVWRPHQDARDGKRETGF